MPTEAAPQTSESIPLTADEIAIVESYRALRIGLSEALRRLATPVTSPILPVGQELHANMPAAADTLIVSEFHGAQGTRPA